MKPLLLALSLLLSLLSPLGALAQGATPAPTVPGAVLSSDYVNLVSVNNLNAITRRFYDREVPAAQFPVEEYRLTFTSQAANGHPETVVAQLFVPRPEDPAELPIYVLGAGTTGLSEQCAASQERPAVQSWGNYRAYLLTHAAQGFITIMPDYQGMNHPERIQPYYVAEMQGRVALDAARAVQDFFEQRLYRAENPVRPQPAVFIGGYSQGGTTIFGARDIQPDYAPDVPLAGLIGYGAVRDQISHMITPP
ncbi:MAG: hypothetical protein HC915_18110, partial [Anaerolineae bacterium]|nr:hypothetical protein [Anaerolineae bacterium]